MNKKISLWELVFMNVSALYGIRWIAKSTASSFGLGLGAIPTWIIITFIFFVPISLMCAELTSTYPKDGGMYEWVKQAYGEKYGFIVSWLNWIARVFWYTAFLTFFSVNITFVIGKPELAQNKSFIFIFSLVVFWIVSYISTKGMTFGKFFTNIGAFGSTIPTIILMLLAFFGVILGKHNIASDYSLHNFIPKINADSLIAISTIMFGLSGAEITANFVTEIEDARKNFPRAIIISAAITSLLYVLGSLAMTIVLDPKDITASRGLLDAIATISSSWGIGQWLVMLVAFGISLASFGAVIVYTASAIKMLFGSVKEGVFPEKLTKLNSHGIPERAVLFQTILVTIIMILTEFLPGVDIIYNILVTMTSLVSLFPYVMLIFAYIKLKKTHPNVDKQFSMAKKNSTCIWISYMTLIVTIAGVVLSLVPIMDTLMANIWYEIELIGGSILFVSMGFWLWNNYEKRSGNNE